MEFKKDLSFFFKKTKNNVIIMGKNTFLSLPINVRPLKDRLNIVLTSNPDLCLNDKNENIIFTNNDQIHNIILSNRDKYLNLYPYLNKDFIIFFIGGKQIYEKCIPLCETVWVTQIKKDYNCNLILNYNFINYKEDIYDEDYELKIIKYIKL
jgi:dihydrofolate reductase